MTSTDETTAPSVSYASLLADPRLAAAVLVSVAGTLGNNVAAPALPAMGGGLGIPDAQLGLVITAYTLPAMFAVPVAGVLADLYGRRTVVIPSLAAFGLFGGAISLVDTFELVLLLRGFQGVAFAGIMPLSVTILGDLYDGVTGSAAQGVRVSVNGVSSIVVPAAAGALSALAWNYPFLIYAAVFPIAVVAYLVLPETAGSVEPAAGLLDQLRNYVRSIRREVRRPRTATLLAGGGVRDFTRYAIITFVPIFAVRTLDASFAQAGVLLSLRAAGSVLVSPLAGSLVGVISRRWALVGSLLLGAASTALIPFAPDVIWLGIVVLVYSIGDAVFSPVIKDAVTGAAPAASRAGVISGMNVLKYGAQTTSPVFFGFVLAIAGFDPLFLLAAGVVAGYALVLVVVLR